MLKTLTEALGIRQSTPRRIGHARRAIVLGCGPAGMFATHALALGGYEIRVLSKKRRSEMFGAQYLHKPIPGLAAAVDPVEVQYILRGTEEDYARKVYGNAPVPFVSPGKLNATHLAWDIRAAYAKAFSQYLDLIIDMPDIDGEDLSRIIEDEKGNHTLIVSTIPAPAICIKPSHFFRAQPVWAIGDAPERGIFAPRFVEQATIICNGEENPSWYRSANVFGYCTTEWPEATRPPIPSISQVHKPIDTNCDCWAGRVVKLGRYGKWDKSQYSHEAFYRMHGAVMA